MIVSWMLYSVAVALLLGGAAVGAERCLRLYGKPARWVWATALLAGVLLPLIGFAVPDVLPAWPGATPIEAGGADFAATVWHLPNRTFASTGSSSKMLTQTILTLWIAASLVLGLVYTWSAWRLNREIRSCSQSDVGGIPVLMSRDLGPAVVGLKRESIVLPAWTLDIDERVRFLLARHELEHVRVGDQRLLLAGLLVVVLLPWNVSLWWCFSRLRVAVEADCDLRVLRGGVDLRTYSDLLLDVGTRTGPAPISALAFSRNRSSLFRRIHLMTFKPRKRFAHATVAVVATITMALLACETPTPPQGADNTASVPSLGTASPEGAETAATVVQPVVRIRSDNLSDEPAPLIIVDGVIMDPASGFKLEDLNPDSIDRIEVLKGASAVELHGERAAGGIINIYMKTIVRTPNSDSTVS